MSKIPTKSRYSANSDLRKIQLYFEKAFKLIGYNHLNDPQKKVADCIKILPDGIVDKYTLTEQFTQLLGAKELNNLFTSIDYGKYSKKEYFYKQFVESKCNDDILTAFKEDKDNPNEMQLIHFAALSGKIPLISKLIRADIFSVNCSDSNGNTVLHYVAKIGNNKNLMEFLLAPINGIKSKADLNAINNDGDTPLHLAAWNGKLNMLKLLLKYGADLSICNNEELNPTHLAVIKKNSTIVKELHEYGGTMLGMIDGKMSIYWFQEHHPDCMKYIYNHLEFPIEGENLEVCKMVVFHSINSHDFDMLHAFFRDNSISSAETDFSKALLASVANNGDTMLIRAILSMPYNQITGKHDLKIVRLLLDNGAEIDQLSLGEAPLHIAARLGDKGLVQCLLKRKADVLIEDSFGHTAREVAILNGHLDIGARLHFQEISNDVSISGDIYSECS